MDAELVTHLAIGERSRAWTLDELGSFSQACLRNIELIGFFLSVAFALT
jgi:hypothetical protein